MIHDLFISYSQRDKAIADAVCHSMEAASIRCWIAPRDIAHGKTWDDTIVDAITAAKLLVVILSTAANGSRIVLDEVAMALDAGLMVIPFRIEDRPTGALRLRIGRIHWVDAITPPLESRIGELVASVKHNLSTPKKTGENQPPQPESKRSHAADPKASETPALTAEPPVLASEQLNIFGVGMTGRVRLSWEVFQQIERTPRQFQGKLLEVSAILPADLRDLNEPTRRALRLATEFRQRSVVEAFVNLNEGNSYRRIPNGDYHANVLLSDAILHSVNTKLYDGAKWTPFHWEDITDGDVIGRFALLLETRFVGYIKLHRTSSGREPGLFVDLLGLL